MSTAAPTATDRLVAHLVQRGLVPPSVRVDVVPLAGGVSNDVVAVTAPGLDAVAKQALGRLRVAEEWLADPARLDTEGRALRLAGRLLPGAVPAVLDLGDGYLVIERAPGSWRTWKDVLFEGTADTGIAEVLGRSLGIWQRETAGDERVALEFGDTTAFEQLRVDPFHRTVAARHPDLAPAIHRTVEVMASSRACLVHGDYTPKNVLVDPDGSGAWVIDWEVAHYGDPTFDAAWTTGHLALKSVHRPASAPDYRAAAEVFLRSWRAELTDDLPLDEAQLVRQTGCLLLARVDGKSPADYLDPAARARVRALAERLLLDPPADVLHTWELLS